MKYVVCLALVLVLLAACEPGADLGAPDLPAALTQKVIIEEVTGTWCGYCPDGAYQLGLISDANPGLVIGVAFHGGDGLEIPDLTPFAANLAGVPFYPCGGVNRIALGGEVFVDRSDWASLADTALAQAATCALRIESALEGTDLVVTVVFGFRDVPADPVRLTVYLTEDGVTGYPQSNYYNDTPSSSFYQQGNPIVDYVHNHVVRVFLSDPVGDPATAAAPVSGEVYAVSYQGALDAAWVAANMHAVAVLSTDGETDHQRPVLNAQVAALGESGGWD